MATNGSGAGFDAPGLGFFDEEDEATRRDDEALALTLEALRRMAIAVAPPVDDFDDCT